MFRSDDEPSFQTPVTYHYANSPTRSVDRVRKLVLNEFNLTTGGIPGNDDGAAMATLLVMHLLGLYPIPSTREFLIVSPFVPSYTLHNTLLGNVTFKAQDFDPSSLNGDGPLQSNTRAYVKDVTINGKQQTSRCKISFDDIFPAAATADNAIPIPQNTEIIFAMGTQAEVTNCGPDPSDLPSSLSTGGFSTF
jgi:putative alpha-1,2-mannosidase